jgi:hypothetical protein
MPEAQQPATPAGGAGGGGAPATVLPAAALNLSPEQIWKLGRKNDLAVLTPDEVIALLVESDYKDHLKKSARETRLRFWIKPVDESGRRGKLNGRSMLRTLVGLDGDEKRKQAAVNETGHWILDNVSFPGGKTDKGCQQLFERLVWCCERFWGGAVMNHFMEEGMKRARLDTSTIVQQIDCNPAQGNISSAALLYNCQPQRAGAK